MPACDSGDCAGEAVALDRHSDRGAILRHEVAPCRLFLSTEQLPPPLCLSRATSCALFSRCASASRCCCPVSPCPPLSGVVLRAVSLPDAHARPPRRVPVPLLRGALSCSARRRSMSSFLSALCRRNSELVVVRFPSG